MRSYIVVVSPSYGGAEKRFFDIFTSLLRKGADVVLVAPSSLVDQLKADHQDRQDVLAALVPVTMGAWSRLEFVSKFRKLLRTLPRGGRLLNRWADRRNRPGICARSPLCRASWFRQSERNPESSSSPFAKVGRPQTTPQSASTWRFRSGPTSLSEDRA